MNRILFVLTIEFYFVVGLAIGWISGADTQRLRNDTMVAPCPKCRAALQPDEPLTGMLDSGILRVKDADNLKSANLIQKKKTEVRCLICGGPKGECVQLPAGHGCSKRPRGDDDGSWPDGDYGDWIKVDGVWRHRTQY